MINKEVKCIDVTYITELLHVAEEVHRSNQPILLTKNGEDLVEVRLPRLLKRGVFLKGYSLRMTLYGTFLAQRRANQLMLPRSMSRMHQVFVTRGIVAVR